MQWFPGSTVPGVSERVEHGLSFGMVQTAEGPRRVWHGDDVIVAASGIAVVVPGPAADACEAEFAARAKRD